MGERPYISDHVGIAEVTGWKILHVRGSESDGLLYSLSNVPSMAIGGVLTVSDGVLVRLRRDEFVLLAADVQPAIDQIAVKAGGAFITLTDITHGRGIIYLGGKHAPDVLPKICALDFDLSKFPNLHAAQTNLAKVRALIIRMDTKLDAAQVPTYYVIVERSVAGYVAEVIDDAAQEWGGIVLSKESLAHLRK